MANILKQIKVGNTTYNIEPYTAYLPLYDLGNATFKVTRGASQSTKNTGYWAGMLNSGQTGSPTLPSTGAWWHVISMDWTSTDSNNWISQLALPTQHGGVPHYRRNNATDTSIDSSTWHAFITDENIGSQSVKYATSAGSAKASDVYAWAKASSKPSYTKSEVGLGNVDNTADANKSVNYANSANSANYFNYGRGVTLANSSSFRNNFCKDIFGEENNNNYHLVELRTQSQAPSCLFGDYSSGIAWKGSDTYGSLMVRYSTSEIRVSGGNGANTNPNWTVDLVHSGNIGSQNVNYANSAGSVAWGNVTGKPSTFPPDSHTHNYLPVNQYGGVSLSGVLDLSSSNNGIKFSSATYYVTNIEAGSVDVNIGTASAGYTTYVTATFQRYNKGSGSWYVVATVRGDSPAQPECVVAGIGDVNSNGIKIRVRKIANNSNGANPTWKINWIAIKYY